MENQTLTMMKATLQDAMAQSLAHYNGDPECWDGWDWWQLSPQEAEVFGITAARWAELLPVWQAFEFLIQRTDGWNDPYIERTYPNVNTIMQATRDRHPEWVSLNAAARSFMEFARDYADMRPREAMAMYAKMDFWAVRVGVYVFTNELN
ncbi:TPA: hypothetical protein N2C61_006455 [Pseudomonas aeruginosa]|uniref:hypothetical protein n=1 Tax=Alcaligenes xylosoxydans xylosoxydans TaxID=85698 RepID=UPI0003323057|nr:hypothetical protein [Achromobacter xylosoxidans]CCH05721.1 hypothetical protein NH44784_017491 [Achromobacter xylosoxidans NH44784-1996]HCL4135290.1 hypothetical protein [Pseudomonas aeruginosa]